MKHVKSWQSHLLKSWQSRLLALVLCPATLACAQDRSIALDDGPYVQDVLVEAGGEAVIVQELVNVSGESARERRLVRIRTADGARTVLARELGPDAGDGGSRLGVASGTGRHELLTWWKRELRQLDARDGAVRRTWRTAHEREWLLDAAPYQGRVVAATSLDRVLLFDPAADDARELCRWSEQPVDPEAAEVGGYLARYQASNVWIPRPDRLLVGTRREFQVRALPGGELLNTVRLQEAGSERLGWDERTIYATTHYTPGHSSASFCYGVFRFNLDSGAELAPLAVSGEEACVLQRVRPERVLPGGDLLMVGKDGSWNLVSTLTGEARPGPERPSELLELVFSPDGRHVALLTGQVVTGHLPPEMVDIRLRVVDTSSFLR